MDKDANLQDIKTSVGEVSKIYGLYDASANIELFVPDDYSRFSPEMREKTNEWLVNQSDE
jgi:hypothetical protein